MNEIWKIWPGDPLGFVEVSNLGNIRSWKLGGGHTRNRRAQTPRLLKGYHHANGYWQTTIWLDGVRRKVSFHRVVCETFHGPAPTVKHQAAHLDGNSSNNAASNLAWKTSKENHADRILHGTTKRGVLNSNAALTQTQVNAIRKEYANGMSIQRITKLVGISVNSISAVCNNKAYM